MILALLPMLCACGPAVYTMSLEMREPSAVGYDFTGKSVSIVYVHGAAEGDSLFSASLAEGIALELEAEYFNSETVIPFYTLPYTTGADYRNKDTLVTLLCQTNSDVLMLLDAPQMGNQVQQMIYVMDAYDKADTVKAFRATLNPEFSAGDSGAGIASNFIARWVKEEHGIYYFNTQEWLDAADLAADLNFKDAMNGFMELARKGSVEKRSSAAYDMAFCCYMLKEYNLALQWLDVSDDYMELPRTSWLRRKILNHIN